MHMVQSSRSMGSICPWTRCLLQLMEALQGHLVAAVQQLELAQKAGDGDFFEHSQVDARLRELKIRQQEEAKQKLPL